MPLRRREKVQLITLVAEGLTNAAIAQQIRLNADRKREGWEWWSTGITGNAVSNFIVEMMGWLGANNRTQLVHLAHQKGILAIDGGALIDVVHENGDHDYYSTHCRHNNHEACKATELAPGVPRTPASCKTCGALCLCPCHDET